jgi:hypothetical protein
MMAPGETSMLRISHFALLAAACTAAGAASAPCPEESRGTLEEWKCYGEVEYAARMEGEDFGARFVLFESGERLYEKRDSAGTKMRLMGRGWQLYRGLEREDSTVVGRHDPFIFFEFALITPLVALAASGQPPSALAQGPTPVAYTVDSAPIALLREIGIRSVKGRIEKQGERYAFAADSVGNVPTGLLAMSVQGHWTPEMPPSFPDSMPLAGWRYHCTPTSVDVRNNHRPVPPGITLEDVRKGWRGAC